MKKYLLSILTLVFAFGLTVQAADGDGNTVTLGYCNGQASTTATIEESGRGWLECALRLPASALQNYAGSEIQAVRAAIVQRINTDSLVVWVRKELNGENLAEQLIRRSGTTPTIQQGWNEIFFDQPFQIPSEVEDLYIGYSIYQRTGVKIISQVQPPVLNSTYYRFDGSSWKDISGSGVASIEALIGGGTMPDYELGFLSATISPELAVSPTALRVSLTAHNYGLKEITGFRVKASAPGIEAVESDVEASVPVGSTVECEFIFDPGVETNEYTQWTLELVSLKDGEDQSADNNTVNPAFAFQRNALIEEFTTLRCPNCPPVAALLKEVLSQSPYAERVYAIAHHSGYYTDIFTVDADYDYLSFYGTGYPYAPSLMLNRRPNYPYYENKNQKVTNFIPSSEEELKGYLNTELLRGSNVVLGMSLTFNADSTRLTVTVDARKNGNYSTPSPRLNVFLLEDEVLTRDQAGTSGEYYLEHVTRGYNSTWGTSVDWDGKDYSYTYTFDLDGKWNKENMEVVAFIYNYDYSSINNREVDNAVRVKLADSGKEVTGIRPISPTEEALTEVGRYDLSGRPVDKATKGVQVVRFSNGTAKKVVVL